MTSDGKFADAVWGALKGDHNDLRRQQIILQAHREALASTQPAIRDGGWRPMAEAPESRKPILAKLRPTDGFENADWPFPPNLDGYLVIRRDAHGGWATRGYGGIGANKFVGWRPVEALPPPPTEPSRGEAETLETVAGAFERKSAALLDGLEPNSPDLGEVKALLEKATAGPWKHNHVEHDGVLIVDAIENQDGEAIIVDVQEPADAALIVALVNAAPELIGRVRRAEEDNVGLRLALSGAGQIIEGRNTAEAQLSAIREKLEMATGRISEAHSKASRLSGFSQINEDMGRVVQGQVETTRELHLLLTDLLTHLNKEG